MLKSCGNTINRHLELIFKQSLITCTCPSDWKKGNIVPFHKKGDKQNIKNNSPVSLLPIYRKVFGRIFFNTVFSIFYSTPGDSYIYQLLSVTHGIYKSFDDGFEVRSVFLVISKAFDKV